MAELVWKRAPDPAPKYKVAEMWEGFVGDWKVASVVSFQDSKPEVGWEVPGIETPDGEWPEDRDINDYYGYVPTVEEAKAAAEASLRKYQVIP